jgi:hypothetical protein
MSRRTAIATTDVLLGAAVVLAFAVGGVALWWAIGGLGDGAPAPGPSPPTADDAPPPIDPALIRYRQQASWPVPLEEVRGLAVDGEGRIYVAGDRKIVVLGPEGAKQREIALDVAPVCLAVGSSEHAAPGRIYVAASDHVEVLAPDGTLAASWPSPAGKPVFTSIAAGESGVYVADAGNRIIWRYDADGKLLGRIGQPDGARKIPGFFITSDHFDLGLGPDGLVYAVNPRMLRIEGYTPRGDLEFFWGKGASAVEGFFGCCNPAHFAILPDGRFVTAEKGAPRVKVYGPRGDFECVVAGPAQVADAPADLAVDGRGRVLLLDGATRSVRVFVPVDEPPAVGGEKP